MNELNLKDISKETTKGPTKVMVAIARYQGCLQNLAKLLYHYKSSVYNCNWYLIRNVCPYHMKEKCAYSCHCCKGSYFFLCKGIVDP